MDDFTANLFRYGTPPRVPFQQISPEVRRVRLAYIDRAAKSHAFAPLIWGGGGGGAGGKY